MVQVTDEYSFENDLFNSTNLVVAYIIKVISRNKRFNGLFLKSISLQRRIDKILIKKIKLVILKSKNNKS